MAADVQTPVFGLSYRLFDTLAVVAAVDPAQRLVIDRLDPELHPYLPFFRKLFEVVEGFVGDAVRAGPDTEPHDVVKRQGSFIQGAQRLQRSIGVRKALKIDEKFPGSMIVAQLAGEGFKLPLHLLQLLLEVGVMG